MRAFQAVLTLAALLAAVALQACGPKPGEEESVRAIFDQVRTGRFEDVESRLAEQNRTPETRATLEQLRRDFIPAGEPQSVRRLHWGFSQTADLQATSRTITAIHEYTYPDRILIVTTTLRTVDSSPQSIENFHINAFNPAEARANEFTLQGKSLNQLAFFGVLVASVALMAMALLGSLFTRSFKRKWLWAIISLAGAPVFLMNWTTGAWEPQFALGLINAGVTRGLSPLDPWILKFQIPIGALVTLSLLLPHWVGRAPAGDARS